LAFSKHGAKVVIGDLDVPGAQAVVSTITKDGGKAVATKCNVVSWDDQLSLFELAFEKYGAVDIVIANAGITEIEPGTCVGDLNVVDGKPVAPKLVTLEVNLIGVFYTVHLGVHYVKRNRTPDSWKAIVMMGSVASWQAIPGGPQYSASKHGVLGLMRSLDPVVAVDNIRVAAIHPWFADTSILKISTKLMLAGFPTTPVPRIAGAIFRAATDPDIATTGCPWVLLDDGPVIRVEKEVLRAGVYELLNRRLRRATGLAITVRDWARLVRDLGRIFRPVLLVAAVPAVLAIAYSKGLIF